MKPTKSIIFGNLAMMVGAILVLVSCDRSLSPEEWQIKLSEAASVGNIPLMKRAIAHGANINKFCCGRNPPLNEAAGRGHLEAVRFLISQGANVNVSAKFLITPLMEASRGGHLQIVKLLLEHQANPNAVEAMEGSSVLDWADGKPEIIKVLKENGAVIENPEIWEKLRGKQQ